MSSSCIPTGLRLDLDMVKAAASPGAHSSPLRPAHSSPSSTLSDASNASSSATSVSLKRARAPRKRPNQAYNEAAALLASIHPSVFPVKKTPKTAARPQLTAAFDPLLPPLPVLADAAFLLRDTPPPQSPSSGGKNNCSSPAPVSSAFRDFRDPAPPSPATPEADDDELGEIDFDDDCFDAESILDEAAGDAAEGIDSIMGSLTVESSSTAAATDDSILSSSGIHPYLRRLMVVGLAGRFELGLGFRHGPRPNLNRALKRQDDDGAWWMWPAVPVKDLTVVPPPPPATTTTTTTTPEAASNTGMPTQAAPEKKKSKKKKVVKMEKVMAKAKEEMPNAKCKEEAVDAANGDGDAADSMPAKAPKTGLGLKLDADEVLKEWSDKGSMFAEGSATDSTTSAADMRAKLADIDLFPENGAGGIREASVLRYKEKRRTRLFSKKIRYQVRKVNADCRPRMKGRFVRSPSLLQQALEEES
ncbi:hypothetical protein QOZ80_2AG0101540 [Eleusine coracana subsp. coracana]|nr:hypothetical protein QOZ80_2AG0101540 [Eleusine coracana subsp. coracana]